MKKGIRCLAVVLVMVMMMSFMFTGCSFIEQYVIDDATEDYIEDTFIQTLTFKIELQ